MQDPAAAYLSILSSQEMQQDGASSANQFVQFISDAEKPGVNFSNAQHLSS